MVPDPMRYECRAWAPWFQHLPDPRGEPSRAETYLMPLGRVSLNIKLRGDALEIKELKLEDGDLQLWAQAARLPLPVPALTLERELMTLLQIGQPLEREIYDEAAIMADIVHARRNLAALTVHKRRRLFTALGCRAETVQVVLPDGSELMSAAVEDAEAAEVRAAVRFMSLDGLPNRSYPQILEPFARLEVFP